MFSALLCLFRSCAQLVDCKLVLGTSYTLSDLWDLGEVMIAMHGMLLCIFMLFVVVKNGRLYGYTGRTINSSIDALSHDRRTRMSVKC